jgi:hypothetical protein
LYQIHFFIYSKLKFGFLSKHKVQNGVSMGSLVPQ